jgi:uncharacterized membrane protein YdcZ (DUF606 family)
LRIGVAPTPTLVVVWQDVVGALLDYFGYLDETVIPMDATRMMNMPILILGSWLNVR